MVFFHLRTRVESTCQNNGSDIRTEIFFLPQTLRNQKPGVSTRPKAGARKRTHESKYLKGEAASQNIYRGMFPTSLLMPFFLTDINGSLVFLGGARCVTQAKQVPRTNFAREKSPCVFVVMRVRWDRKIIPGVCGIAH